MADYRFDSPINVSLPTLPQGVKPEDFNQFSLLYNAINSLLLGVTQFCGLAARPSTEWNQLSPTDTLFPQNVNRLYGAATETIAFGALVSIENSSGMKFRNANATGNTRPALGFCNTVGGIASGAFGEVIVGMGLSTGIAGLVIGTRYFLSTTNGLVTNTEPVAAGNIGQPVGMALSSSLFFFMPTLGWVQH
jgi:hypothetical protein